MNPLFSDDTRRNPYPLYEQMRRTSPVLHVPPPFDIWLVFDYEGVKRVVSDPETFSSAVPAPREWFIFWDPPRHTKRRAVVPQALPPRLGVNPGPRVLVPWGPLLARPLRSGGMDRRDGHPGPRPL